MRSLWVVTLVSAAVGGATGAALGWWLQVSAGGEGATTRAPGADKFARIERRLDRIEGGMASAAQPVTTPHGAPQRADGARTGTNEAEERRWKGFAADLEVLKERIAAIAAAQDLLEETVGVPPRWPRDPAAVEKIRDAWQSKLEETETGLWSVYPQGPDPRGDFVGWSRFEDLRRAKAAFEAATDAASLRALSEGEFCYIFTVTR